MKNIVEKIDKLWGKILRIKSAPVRLLIGIPYVMLFTTLRLILTIINAGFYFIAVIIDFVVDTPKVLIMITKKLIKGVE